MTAADPAQSPTTAAGQADCIETTWPRDAKGYGTVTPLTLPETDTGGER